VPSPVEDRDDAMHQGRLHYLDALRSFCMLYGVFVHTSAFLGPQAIGLIGPASAYFRMGTFFLVSGFLVPLVAGTPFAWVAFATVLYLPYFGLGVLMHAGRGLFERMHRASPVALGLGALLLVAAAALPAGLPRAAGTIADIVARAVLTVALVATLLGLARALVPARSRVVTLLIDSIYTVYLLHYLAIYALGLLLLRWLPAGPAYYLTLAPLVIVLLVGFHHRVVARSPLLRLLLNGRPTPVAAALPTG